MSSVAFATSLKFPDFASSDELVVEELSKRGIRVKPAPWNDSSVEWDCFELVVLRSTWDYHLFRNEFISWMQVLAKKGIEVRNDPHLVEWNIDKSYLQELQNSGGKIPKTVFLPQGTETDLRSVLAEDGLIHYVMKPSVGASSYRVTRGNLSTIEHDAIELSSLLEKSGVLIQELVEEVSLCGGTSPVFVNGNFSHAVRRVPAKGNFLADPNAGAKESLITPTRKFISDAQAILQVTTLDSLYARVDVVESRMGTVLMELELVEPWLFFDLYPLGAEKFADAIVRLLKSI